MLGQHSMKGVQRQAQPMISKEFIAQLLDAELARAAKFEDGTIRNFVRSGAVQLTRPWLV